MNTFGLDQNIVLALLLVSAGLVLYWLATFTSRGKKTTRTIRKKERAWLQSEKRYFGKLLKYLLGPVVLFWIFIDTLFAVFANYYFHNVIFEPIFGFTPMQTLIATILLLLFGFIVYRFYIKRGAKK